MGGAKGFSGRCKPLDIFACYAPRKTVRWKNEHVLDAVLRDGRTQVDYVTFRCFCVWKRSRSELRGGLTNTPYFTSQVDCTGNEDSIFKCRRMQSNLNFGCDYNRAAGVDCEMGVRLVGSDLSDRGRVEIQHKGEWGTICDPHWTGNDAEVVCRMLGMSGGRAVSQATFGAGTGRILLSNVVCNGYENHLMDCRHSPFRVHTCDHSQDVGVVCSK